MGKDNTVIAPSVYARSSDRRIRKIIKGLIGRSLDDCLRNRGMTVKKYLQKTGGTSFKQAMLMLVWILVSSTSMTGTGRAECIPTPDCASIGYTESSCDGKFTRCPFDTSKLFCVPCDSAYRYTCSGDNIRGGVGPTCGGKYASCSCVSIDYTFSNGFCLCDSLCSVGAIYYSDGSCSKCIDNNKTIIGIVIKDNELVMSPLVQRTWSFSSFTDISKIINIDTIEDAYVEYNGIINTNAIVSAYNNDTADNNAGIYCNSYSPTGTTAGDWYLPAVGELYSYVHMNYSKLTKATNLLGWIYFNNSFFWSSSEGVGANVWGINITTGNINSANHRKNSYTITCFHKIK